MAVCSLLYLSQVKQHIKLSYIISGRKKTRSLPTRTPLVPQLGKTQRADSEGLPHLGFR